MKTILVLCTGNSCRSIMAEAVINHLCEDRYTAVSAGSHPAGFVHPKSLETLRRNKIPCEAPRSKFWDEFVDRQIDLVLTVCDQAVNESCPVFLGSYTKLHWNIPDPAAVTGTEQEINAAFDEIFHVLKNRIETELR